VLDRYDLFNKEIILKNGERHTYGTYKVPCCQACNTLLGREVEIPVSQLLRGGYAAVAARLDPDTIKLLFTWLCLIFVKIHMKDRLLRMNRDPRIDRRMMADGYYWPDLHHVHAVARTSFTQAAIDPGVVGSMIFLPIDDPTTNDSFDWVDFSDEKTIALRVDNLGVIAVLNDSCAAQIALADRIAAIEGPITTTQMRELAARFAVANAAVLNRPEFGTLVRRGPPSRVRLWATHEAVPRFSDFDHDHYGRALALILQDRFDSLVIDGVRGADKVREKILTGKASFLFDEEGRFMRELRRTERT
jgi:hypothetical protein